VASLFPNGEILRRWLGKTLARKFSLLLAGFLVLQVVQLVVIVFAFQHISEEAAFINEAGKQRMRTLLVSSYAHSVVHPVGSRAEQQILLERLADSVNRYGDFYARLAEFQRGRHAIANWLDRDRIEPAYRLLGESRVVWENELRPLAVTVAMAPSAGQSAAALRKLEGSLPGQLQRINQAVTLLEADVRANTHEMVLAVSVLLGSSLLLGFAGFAMARFQVTLPLRRLIEGTRAVADGAYDRRVPIRSSDELGQLGEVFNRMAWTVGQKTARITAFQEVAATIASTNDSEEAINRVMQFGAEAIGARAACVVLCDEVSGEFHHRHTYGLSEEFVAGMVFRPGGLADQVLRSGEPCLSYDGPGSIHRLSDHARREGIFSFICLPLIAGDDRLGVMYFYRHARKIFSAEESDVLATFARLAAQSIRNARLYQRVSEEARTDDLTGLLNRRVFNRRLSEEHSRAQRYQKPYAVAMLDIDHFKRINDNYGHQSGDAILRQMGALLARQFRDMDIVARYGGEEFIVLLVETGGGTAKGVMERVRRAIAGTSFMLPDRREIGVTVSIGISCFPNCATDAQAAVNTADQALYTAKQAGRNRVKLYREILKARLDKRPELVVEMLQESLDNIHPVAAAITNKTATLREHAVHVQRATARLAEALGLPPDEREVLERAALLHDIGMLLVPDALLSQTTPLSDDDWRLIRQHSVTAAKWLARVPALTSVVPVVRHHHERMDGSGYPDGLRGDEIPLLARILAVTDSYSAMIDGQPGRAGMAPAKALERLRAAAGTQFDPRIVKQFVQVIESGQKI